MSEETKRESAVEMRIWHSVLAGLLLAGVLAAWSSAQKLSSIEARLTSIEKRIGKMDDRITWLERRRGFYGDSSE